MQPIAYSQPSFFHFLHFLQFLQRARVSPHRYRLSVGLTAEKLNENKY